MVKKTEVIYNGLDVKKFPFKERRPGFNIGWVGIIDHKKNPPLMLQIIKELVDIDPRYRLHVAGNFRDPRYEIYLKYMVKEMGLKGNVIFYGWVKDISRWWDDKEYLLSTSIHESFGYSIVEGMARGIKPIIHNFFGAKGLYEVEWLYNTCKEAVERIRDPNYDSLKYRVHVEANWDLRIQIRKIKRLLSELIHPPF
jgi:glycosyltransferase involved in cell wall biosynthesis